MNAPKNGDAQPEKMQRRLMLGASQPNRGADEQRKDSDARQRQIQPARARGHRCNRDGGLLPRIQPQHSVAEGRPGVAAVQRRYHVIGAFDRAAVDRQKHVAALQSGSLGGGPGGDFRSDDVAAGCLPQDAVLELRPVPALENIRDREAQEDGHDQAGTCRAHPSACCRESRHAYGVYPVEPSKRHTPNPPRGMRLKYLHFNSLRACRRQRTTAFQSVGTAIQKIGRGASG